jgi:thiol-disulfide isomerase/thioredoxin
MKKLNALRLASSVLLGVLCWQMPLPAAEKEVNEVDPAIAAKEKEACGKNLKMIYQAVQAYRREHKDLPNWLSDLVPKYLADASILVCPVTKRTGVAGPYQHLTDSKIRTSYIYEFSDAEMGTVWGGRHMKMRDFKRMEMGLVGGDVPILRCHLHAPVLNLGFDGKFYESPRDWESLFTDVVPFEDFNPERLIALYTKAVPAQTTEAEAENPVARGNSETPGAALLGKPAPNFKLDLLAGGQFDLAEHKSKHIVILDFWATWCGPCRAALPVMTQIAAEYQNKDVRYFAVDLREKPDQIKAYLEKSGLKMAVPLDRDGEVGRLYKVTGIPTLVIISKDGTVQIVQVGFSPDLKEQLKGKLDQLVAGRALHSGPPAQ